MEKVQVFVMTRNRPKMVIKSVNSILSQTYPNIEIVVSDNSTDDETSAILQPYISKRLIKYIKQIPMSGIEHLNTIHKIASSRYYMIFHDDDEMCESMVENLYKIIGNKVDIAAVGCNAYKVINGVLKKKLYSQITNNVTFDNMADISRQYLSYNIVPFPSYMYNRDLVLGAQLNPSVGGKYSDASFIISLINYGKIYWLSMPLMKYYFHPSQDSYTFDSKQYLSLLNFYKKCGITKKELQAHRILTIYNYNIERNKFYGYPYKMSKMLLFYHFSFVYGFKYMLRFIKEMV